VGYKPKLLRGAFAMAKKDLTEYVSGNEAALIMTRNSGHEVKPAYVRLLASQNKIRSKMLDGRTRGYHRGDVEAYRVERKSKKDTLSGEQADGEAA
jgi:hypothetical protein